MIDGLKASVSGEKVRELVVARVNVVGSEQAQLMALQDPTFAHQIRELVNEMAWLQMLFAGVNPAEVYLLTRWELSAIGVGAG